MGLLVPLYLAPHQVSSFSEQIDGVALVRVVHLHHVLDLPDIRQGSSQPLFGTLLLLTLLLLALLALLSLLLVSLGHLPHPFFVSRLILGAAFLAPYWCTHYGGEGHPWNEWLAVRGVPYEARRWAGCLAVSVGGYTRGSGRRPGARPERRLARASGLPGVP